MPMTPTSLRYLQHQDSSLTWASIDLDTLRGNYRAMRQYTPDGTEVMGVVKANGYGHGAAPIGKALALEGCEWFGVATLEEAIALRQDLPKKRILVLSRLVPWNADLVVRNNLTPIIFNRELALAFNQAARDARRVIPVHIKVDTGMGRLGCLPDELREFCCFLRNLEYLEVEGICTNFSTADDLEDSRYFERQLAAFDRSVAIVRSHFPTMTMAHCANSATLLRDVKRAGYDMVRPGIMLYGVYPMELEPPPVDVVPALQLKTRIIHLQDQPDGIGISYGATYVTKGTRRIATIPIGYRDGLNRHLSNRAEFLLREQRVPLVGKVCMDLAMLDVTEVEEVALYDEVILIGRQNGEVLHVTELADWIGTIPYEVFCTIGARVERRYVSRDERLKPEKIALPGPNF